MKKKVLSLFLALGLCLGLLPTAALAAEATVTEVVPCKYYEVKDFSDGLAAVKVDSGEKDNWDRPVYKWGFIDATGKEVVPCKYYEVGDFSDGLGAVRGENGYGVIDTTGKEVVPCKYYEVGDFSEGLAAVRGENGYGFIDATGKEIVPCKYNDAKDFSEGLAAVKLDGRWGVIDTTGKEVVPCTLDYNDIKPFSEGLAAVRGENGWGFIDKTGKEVVACKYSKVEDFSEGLVAVMTPTKMEGVWILSDDKKIEKTFSVDTWGFIDKTGKEVIPCKYVRAGTLDEAPVFSDGSAAVFSITDVELDKRVGTMRYNGENGLIDKAGKEVVPLGKYTNVRDFSEGLAAVQVKDENGKYKWGFIDKTCKEVVPCTLDYFDIEPFSKGFAAVTTGEFPNYKYGFIDKTGKEVMPCKYDGVKDFSEGLAAVKIDSGEKDNSNRTIYKWGFISVNGSAAPTPAPSATTAYASTQTVMVDNKPVEFNAYALKDENGNMTNYVKLRDVADVLNGSAAQFQVGWDGSISITTKQAYTANGSEMVKNFSGDQQYTVNTSPVKINGVTADMEAITLTDSTGGYTYFKLRDLGKMLGFNVSWIDGKIVIDPNSPYSDAN